MFRAIDARVLSAYQSAAVAIQRLAGLSCYRVAEICGLLFAAIAVCSGQVAEFWLLGLPAVGTVAYAFFGRAFDEKIAATHPELLNRRKVDLLWVVLRASACFVFLLWVVTVIWLGTPRSFVQLAQQAAWTSWLYFIACDPLPPAKSRLRQLWEARLPRPVAAHA